MSAHALPTSEGVPLLRRGRGDAALSAHAAAGDAGAFAALYERHHKELYRYCRSILRHDEDARDALHNAMIKAWEALRRGDRDVALRPWLFRIAHNEAVSVLRTRRSHDTLDETHVTGSCLEDDVEMRQRLTRLRSDLAVLPDRQRSALLLRELCGLSHDEIAAVLLVSRATARQTIYEARLALHEAEAGREMSCAAIRRALSDGDGRVRRGRRIRGHIRDCSGCASFQDLLRRRPDELAALFPPLPGAALVGLLARTLSLEGAGSVAAGAGSAAGTAAGPAAIATSTIANLATGTVAKVAVGSAVLATAGGAVPVERVVGSLQAATPAPVTSPGHPSRPLAAGPPSGVVLPSLHARPSLPPLAFTAPTPGPAGPSATATAPGATVASPANAAAATQHPASTTLPAVETPHHATSTAPRPADPDAPATPAPPARSRTPHRVPSAATAETGPGAPSAEHERPPAAAKPAAGRLGVKPAPPAATDAPPRATPELAEADAPPRADRAAAGQDPAGAKEAPPERVEGLLAQAGRSDPPVDRPAPEPAAASDGGPAAVHAAAVTDPARQPERPEQAGPKDRPADEAAVTASDPSEQSIPAGPPARPGPALPEQAGPKDRPAGEPVLTAHDPSEQSGRAGASARPGPTLPEQAGPKVRPAGPLERAEQAGSKDRPAAEPVVVVSERPEQPGPKVRPAGPLERPEQPGPKVRPPGPLERAEQAGSKDRPAAEPVVAAPEWHESRVDAAAKAPAADSPGRSHNPSNDRPLDRAPASPERDEPAELAPSLPADSGAKDPPPERSPAERQEPGPPEPRAERPPAQPQSASPGHEPRGPGASDGSSRGPGGPAAGSPGGSHALGGD